MKFVEDFVSHHDSEQTRRAYRHDLRQFMQFVGEELRADSTVPVMPDRGDLQAFVDDMRSKELSQATQRRRISAVRRFYKWLREQGVIPHNPIGDSNVSFRPPDGSEEASESGSFLSKNQLQSILDSMDRDTRRGRRDYALVLLILFAALRRGEAAALNAEDVRPLSRHWILDLPSSGRGQGGYVPVPDDVAEAVQRLVDTYEAPEGPLWRSFSPQNRGDRLSPGALYKSVRRAGRVADVEGVSIERLRQSGLRLASKGGSTVDELRRHARLKRPTSAVRYCTQADSSRLSSQVGTRIDLDL